MFAQSPDRTASMNKVFISYAHVSDNQAVIQKLKRVLETEGLKVTLDTDVTLPTGPNNGWDIWMEQRLKESDWVLMLFDPDYRSAFDGHGGKSKGFGTAWETKLIRAELYRNHAKNERFIPLLRDDADRGLIPANLSLGYSYHVPRDALLLAQRLKIHGGLRCRHCGEAWGWLVDYVVV